MRADAPGQEPPANGPDVEACVREALTSLSGRQHQDPQTGRFVAGGQSSTTTGARSAVLWSALAPAKRDLVESVTRDLGMNGDTPTTLAGLIDAYAESRLFRQAMYCRLVDDGGAVTAKGRVRALYTAYLAALDRETKLAQVLGLTRRSKAIGAASLDAYLAAQQPESPEGT